jgi:hypothetical protein
MRTVLRRLVRPRVFVQYTGAFFSPDYRGAFKVASNAFVGEEHVLGDVGAERDSGAFTSAGDAR